MTYQNRVSKLYDIYVVIENFNNKLTGELSQELIDKFTLFKQISNIQRGIFYIIYSKEIIEMKENIYLMVKI